MADDNSHGWWSWIPVVGSVVDGIVGAVNTNSTNKTNIRLAQEQREWSEKMWNLQNEYNTPSAVMSRYRDAGINPNFIVGQSGSGLASTPLNTQAAKVNPIPPTNIGQSIGMAVQLRQQKESLEMQKGLAKSQEFKNRCEGIGELLKQPGIMKDNEIKKWTADFLAETFGGRKENVYLQNDLLKVQAGVGKEQIETLKKQQDVLTTQIDLINNQIYNQNRMTDKQLEYMDNQMTVSLGMMNAALKQAAAAQVMASAAFKNATTQEKQLEIDRVYKEKLGLLFDAQADLMHQQYRFNDETWNDRKLQAKALWIDLMAGAKYKNVQAEFLEETSWLRKWGMLNQNLEGSAGFVENRLTFPLRTLNTLMNCVSGGENNSYMDLSAPNVSGFGLPQFMY